MAKILVVNKDVAEFNIYSAVVSVLRESGHSVEVVAEGISLERWEKSGEEVYGGVVTLDDKGCRHDINPARAINDIAPDLVLAGLGSPINLGDKFGVEANQCGIKLGFVEDIWGVHSRSSAIPNFICTLDPSGKRQIEGYVPYKDRMPFIHVTGSPALDRLAKVSNDPVIAGAASNYHLTVLLVGQDESTTPVITGLLYALGQISTSIGGGRVLLLPRLHPKFMNRDEFIGPWLRALAQAPCDVLWTDPKKITTVELMRSADFTVSIYSNTLLEASVLGSVPVSWVSEIGQQKMAESMGGIRKFPLVDIGCALEVSSADDFLGITEGRRDALLEKCKQVFPNDGGNAERVVSAIDEELRR